MRTLDGKVVVITGAGSGIGRALAVECARRGALVALSDINDAGLSETCRLLPSSDQVHQSPLDVADRPAMMAYAAQICAHFGQVNVLINNAGVSLTGNLSELSPADMEWIVGVNLWGVIHGTQAFLPHLIESGDGHLVNISSLFGLISMPGQSLYNATKYAVRGLTESVREEMLIAGHPVRVTCVHPGGIKTGIAANGRVGDGGDLARTVEMFDKHMARMEPAKAARIIVKGVLADKPRVLVGADAHALHQAARLTGARYQDLVAYLSRRRPQP
jgi:NADP-dependent 3-hydroxy acid dehydrogenase YdfG